MNRKKITIAIDGYVGTGKGTTAKELAKKLGYMYLDTGAMYRAVTLYAQRNNLLDADEQTKVAAMQHIDLQFVHNDATDHFDMILNGENVEQVIRTTDLAMQMHKIVPVQGIRNILVQLQRAYGEHGGIVADGRDMGTVVFPDAEVKIFLTCDLETRVERRYKQLVDQGLDADIQKIREEIQLRDNTDYLGRDAVNKKADDAITIDTSHCTIQEQVDMILGIVKEKV